MIRNLKALGCALVAVFAISALSASSATAADVFTTANGQPALLTGVTHNSQFTMTASGFKVECTTAKFAVTMKNGSTEAEINPEYTGKINETPHGVGCSSALGSVTLDTTGCQTQSTGQTVGGHAIAWMTCEAGKTVKITAPIGVTLSFPAQTPTSGGATFVNLPNHPGGAAIQATGTFSGVTYTCTPTFACTLSGIPHHGDDVDINGTVTVTGYADNEGLPTPVTEGARVGVSFHST